VNKQYCSVLKPSAAYALLYVKPFPLYCDDMSVTDVIAISKLFINSLIPPSKTPVIKSCTFFVFLLGKDHMNTP